MEQTKALNALEVGHFCVHSNLSYAQDMAEISLMPRLKALPSPLQISQFTPRRRRPGHAGDLQPKHIPLYRASPTAANTGAFPV
jgi:hypothetical protein